MNCRRYACRYCGFHYDEAAGLPEEGIASGTSWDDLDEEWFCPNCGAEKADFDEEVPA